MFITKPLPFITSYVEEIDKGIKEYNAGVGLSRIQKTWLQFCIIAILITNCVCWSKFNKASLGKYSLAGLSWMLKKSKIPWERLLHMSVRSILRLYKITEGCLGVDESEKRRSKKTKKIFGVHKIKEKTSNGFIMGQCVVFLVLITPKITIPVGFSFHVPDPVLSAWTKEDKTLKKRGVPKKKRPAKPRRNSNYPTIAEISLALLQQFKQYHPDITIKAIFADALYGTAHFMDGASTLFGGIQVVSQMRFNQKIVFRNKEMSVETYFSKYGATIKSVRIRGGKEVSVVMGSARLYVCSHHKKRFVIALKYEGEEEFRYIIASDMSWRAKDIVEAYTLRWLVEVFFEDWKSYEGWGQLTKQTGEDGSSRSLILSLLVDHCLFFHPDQRSLLENKLPANTVGSLIGKIRVECLLSCIQDIILSEDPKKKFEVFSKAISDNVIKLSPSLKHMSGRELGRLEPTPSLKYRLVA